MESSKVFLLLIGICCVSLIRQAHSECCKASVANLCADGTLVKGLYCGRGKCNIFGCNCDGGCRTGDFGGLFWR